MRLHGSYKVVPITEEDAQGLYRLMTLNGDRFKRYFPKTLEENSSPEEARSFVVRKIKQFKLEEEFLFVIKNEMKSQVLGLVYIKELDWQLKQGEFAYCIGLEDAGKGLVKLAVEKLSEYAFDQLGLENLQIIVHQKNLASVKIAEKCGFMWQKTLADEYTPPNELSLDMELFELKKNKKK